MADHKKAPRFGGRSGSCSMTHARRHMSHTVWEASFASMNGWERRPITFEAGDRVRFEYGSHVEIGSLSMELIAPNGTTAVHWGEKSSETTEFEASLTGRYTVRVTADHAAGGYRLELRAE